MQREVYGMIHERKRQGREKNRRGSKRRYISMMVGQSGGRTQDRKDGQKAGDLKGHEDKYKERSTAETFR